MPLFFLKVKAELENIALMTAVQGNLWKFDVQTPTGGEKREGITICTDDAYPLEGSRGEANFVIKWPFSKEYGYIKIIEHRAVKPSYTEADSGEYVTIFAMECRGMEPIAWYPAMDFDVKSTGGATFTQVDLSDRDWAEYDEENDLTVSISNLDYKIDVEP